jgi:hypothetical protein
MEEPLMLYQVTAMRMANKEPFAVNEVGVTDFVPKWIVGRLAANVDQIEVPNSPDVRGSSLFCPSRQSLNKSHLNQRRRAAFFF